MTTRRTPPKASPHTRKELAQRYGTLLFMTIVTIILTAVSFLLILGYQIDPNAQTITQGGLVKFDSFPTGATITLDNQRLTQRTPHQQTDSAQSYQVNFSLKGYKPWNATFSIEPGKLTWIDYARLVPNTIKTTDLSTFPAIAQNMTSPNKQTMLLLPAADQPIISLVSVGDLKNVRTTNFTIPPEALTVAEGKPQSFSLHEWSRNSDYFTVKHLFGDNQVEFIRIQRSQPANSKNISQLLGTSFVDVRFFGNSHDEFYALSEGNLRKISLAGEGELSAPVATHVVDYRVFKDDGVIYTTLHNDVQTVQTLVNNAKITLVTSLPKSATVRIDLGNYYDNFYAAVSVDATLRVYQLQISQKKATFYATIKLAAPAAWVDFATTSRHIIAGTDTAYSMYDIDTKTVYSQAATGTRGMFAHSPLEWLDESYVIVNADNALAIRDYTGYNTEEIALAPTGYSSFLTRDEKNIVFIAAAEGNSRILRAASMVNQ